MPKGIYKRESIIKKGDKYNRLTAIRFDHKRGNQQYWLFKCDCGNEKMLDVSDVKSGNTKSCGCLQKEKIGNLNRTHSMSYTKEYKSWLAMKQRCLNPNEKRYSDYGGRGIKVCSRWMSFKSFFKDMGKRREGMSIDRIDNSKGYSPENCRWTTAKEQSNNTRRNHFLTFNNKTQTIAQWARKLEINYGTLYTRLKKGWSVERALTK